jgi:hypothetical protein
MIAFGGLFAGASILLYFGLKTWDGKYELVNLILATRFNAFLLWAGIVLAALAVIRAISLWRGAGELDEVAAGTHGHDSDHCFHHHGLPAHPPPGGQALPAPVSPPGHTHGPACGHDHESSWAPWRYMVLLFPIIFFFLRLPDKPPRATGLEFVLVGDPKEEAANVTSMVAMGPAPVAQLAIMGSTFFRNPEYVEFKDLESLGVDEMDRKDWKGRMVRVRGIFVPSSVNDRQFTLVRLKITCCRADAIQLRVPILCRETVTDLASEQWVEVVGKVNFLQRGSSWVPVLLVPSRDNVQPCAREYNPYDQ